MTIAATQTPARAMQVERMKVKAGGQRSAWCADNSRAVSWWRSYEFMVFCPMVSRLYRRKCNVPYFSVDKLCIENYFHTTNPNKTVDKSQFSVDNCTMPTLPRAQCSHYGCKAPSFKGSRFCVDHAPAQAKPQSERRSLDDEYRSAAWRLIRTAQLSREPLCACCTYEGRLTAAEVVDHVFPWKGYGPQAFRANLFQSLCAPCHSRKTNLESRGVFRRYTGDAFRDYSPSEYPAALG